MEPDVPSDSPHDWDFVIKAYNEPQKSMGGYPLLVVEHLRRKEWFPILSQIRTLRA